MCQLNLDVLFLLATYILPLDLLNLAHTCKSLQEPLMDESSAFVWKRARRQIKGLPDCPDDLTEQEYANLVFRQHCHGCGRYTKKILWNIRRRYCPGCKITRLCSLDSCPSFVRHDSVVPVEFLGINGVEINCVDKEQLNTITREYDCSTDKEKLLQQKRGKYEVISLHALACKDWEERIPLELRKERCDDIFERLRQRGYAREIAYYGRDEVQAYHDPFFKPCKLLTDGEWELMLPKWVETMDNLAAQRMERTVYRPRRDLLIPMYDGYKALNPPALGLLPHVTEVALFAPFRKVVYATEEAEMGSDSFESAFEQLPGLIDEWKKQLDAGFSELVVIPSHLSSEAISAHPGVETSQAPTDRLQLACAVFVGKSGVRLQGCYPEVLSSVTPHFRPGQLRGREISEPPIFSIERYGIRHAVEAAYIVRACGLDPNVATAEDMDHWNARLECLACPHSYVMTWRTAVHHAICDHSTKSLGLSDWRLVSDEYMDAIQAVELSFKADINSSLVRCLLCHLCVGCAMHRSMIVHHIVRCHGLQRNAVQQDVHYKHMSFRDHRPMLEMMDEGGIMTFKKSSKGIVRHRQLCVVQEGDDGSDSLVQ